MSQVSPANIKKLFGPGSQCAHPDCVQPLISSDKNRTLAGDVAHIEAVSEGGPRYNPKMTNRERNHYDNLIALCLIHHRLVDSKENVEDYPVELLKQWKQEHEDKMRDVFNKNPSLLRQAIYALFEADFPERDHIPSGTLASFEIEAKIKYNAIKGRRIRIREYSAYFAKIDGIYRKLEEDGASFKTQKLLHNIRDTYLRVKELLVGDTDNEMDIIRENADYIFDAVEDRLLESINDPNLFEYKYAISIIMVDAFMRCEILENPNV